MASATAPSSNEILHDFSPLIRVHKDGRVERLEPEEYTPASVDPDTGVESKDAVFDAENGLFVRMYLPKSEANNNNNNNQQKRLPVLVYFHGGGFFIDHASSFKFQNFLNHLVEEANVLAVSVEYRLAPEHPLPAAYRDSWHALQWLANHAKGLANEVWLKDHADFDRVYLGGSSAGGNIAHNMAMRIGLEGLDGLKISGMFLECPYFWGEELIAAEVTYTPPPGFFRFFGTDYIGRIWPFVNPDSPGSDDPQLNPAMDPNVARLGCKKVLVVVAEKDVLKYRGWYYKDVLEERGWGGDIEVVEVEGEVHCYIVVAPKSSEKRVAILKKIALFLNSR